GGHRPATPLITARCTGLSAGQGSGKVRLVRAARRAASSTLRNATPSQTGQGPDPYPAPAAAKLRPSSGNKVPVSRAAGPDHLRPRAARTLTCVIDPQWWQLGLAGLAVLAGAMAVRTTGMGFALLSSPFLVMALGPFEGILVTNVCGIVAALLNLWVVHADL